VQQSGALAVHPLRHPVRQRSRAQVLGLDGWAEPLSGGDGKWSSGYISASEEDTKRRSKRGSTRSWDGGAIDTDEQWSKWIDDENCGGARCCANRVNPTAPPSKPPLYHRRTLVTVGLAGHSGRRLGRLAWATRPCGLSWFW
jgi:hypothetical protein